MKNRNTEISPASIALLARHGSYSIGKAQALLGYAPRVGLADGIQRTEQRLLGQRLI